jgi:hypothetical protein
MPHSTIPCHTVQFHGNAGCGLTHLKHSATKPAHEYTGVLQQREMNMPFEPAAHCDVSAFEASNSLVRQWLDNWTYSAISMLMKKLALCTNLRRVCRRSLSSHSFVKQWLEVECDMTRTAIEHAHECTSVVQHLAGCDKSACSSLVQQGLEVQPDVHMQRPLKLHPVSTRC